MKRQMERQMERQKFRKALIFNLYGRSENPILTHHARMRLCIYILRFKSQ